jgi:hypothetical protein
MRLTVLAVGICICFIAVAAATMAQTPGYAPTASPAPYPIPSPPSYVGPQPAAYPGVPYGYQAPKTPTLSPASSVAGLLAKWKSASESDRQDVEKDLRGCLKKDLQARLGDDENEVKRLEAQLKQLQEKLDLRRQKQDEIVDYHLQGLLRDAQGLGWGQSSVPPMPVEFYPVSVPVPPTYYAPPALAPAPTPAPPSVEPELDR